MYKFILELDRLNIQLVCLGTVSTKALPVVYLIYIKELLNKDGSVQTLDYVNTAMELK